MMRIATVIDRLTAQFVPDTFTAIGGLGAVPASPDVIKWRGRAYVVPRDDIVGPNSAGTGVVSQHVVRVVRVLIGFTRQSPRRMGDLDSIEDVVEAVKGALVGWIPDGEVAPVEYIGSGVEYQNLETGILIWAVDVGCPYFLEE